MTASVDRLERAGFLVVIAWSGPAEAAEISFESIEQWATASAIPFFSAAGVAVLALILLVFSRVRSARLERLVGAAEASFQRTFAEPDISIGDFPRQIERMEVTVNRLVERAKRTGPAQDDDVQFLIVVAKTVASLVDVADAVVPEAASKLADELSDAGVAAALIVAGAEARKVASAPHPRRVLLDGLDTTDAWSGVLTLPNALTFYYGDEPELAGLLKSLRAIEALMLAAFARAGVDIIVPAPFEEIPPDAKFLPRSGASRDMLRHAAASRRAADANRQRARDAERAIADCVSPGWTSSALGPRPPTCVIYERGN